MSNHFVYVYGTLKRDQPNHYFISRLGSARYVGTAVTAEKYPLVIGTPWNLPMMLDKAGHGMHINGEVYEMNDEDLAQVDHFEGHPDLYKRTIIDTIVSQSNKANEKIRCWVYFYVSYTKKEEESPFYETYDSNADHGMKYDTGENADHPGMDTK